MPQMPLPTPRRHLPLALAAPLAVLAAVLAAGPAAAHGGLGQGSGFAAGFLHPMLGADHVVAMVAVGLWGAVLGRPALWLLPVIFPLVMAAGGAAGVLGLPLPAVEAGIAASAIVLGAMVALALRPPLWVAGLLVGVFAVFHGHAHGTELPAAADPAAFAMGFVIATGILHLIGIAFGALVRWPAGAALVRAGGGLVSLAGIAFLTGLA